MHKTIASLSCLLLYYTGMCEHCATHHQDLNPCQPAKRCVRVWLIQPLPSLRRQAVPLATPSCHGNHSSICCGHGEHVTSLPCSHSPQHQADVAVILSTNVKIHAVDVLGPKTRIRKRKMEVFFSPSAKHRFNFCKRPRGR